MEMLAGRLEQFSIIYDLYGGSCRPNSSIIAATLADIRKLVGKRSSDIPGERRDRYVIAIFTVTKHGRTIIADQGHDHSIDHVILRTMEKYEDETTTAWYIGEPKEIAAQQELVVFDEYAPELKYAEKESNSSLWQDLAREVSLWVASAQSKENAADIYRRHAGSDIVRRSKTMPVMFSNSFPKINHSFLGVRVTWSF